MKNRDTFATSLAELPCTNATMHRIDKGDAISPKPLQHHLYSATSTSKADIARQTDKRHEIKKSESLWSYSVLLVTKQTRERRFFVDYRGINSVTEDTYHPLITMEDGIDSKSETQLNIISLQDIGKCHLTMKQLISQQYQHMKTFLN